MTGAPAAAVVDLAGSRWEDELADALPGPKPLVLVLRPCPFPAKAVEPLLHDLLRRSMPVTGVVVGRVAGGGAVLALACDALLWVRGSSLRVQPSGAGEAALLALRLGRAGASRVWFGGGLLPLAEAGRAGWAKGERDLPSAIARAERLYEGLAPRALGLLRPLLYRQAGLGLAQAEVLERAAFSLAFTSGEPREGIRAFLEKRTPRYGKTGDQVIE